MGMEGVGIVEAVGSEVTEVAPGQRVAYRAYPLGAYAGRRVIAADRLVPIPDGIDDETAAAVFIKGMTARCLIRLVHEARSGDVVLPHAVAGATGLLAAANETFAMVRSGKLRVRIHKRYPLSELARAHHDLAGRATTGSSVLLP
jgi:NADPH2:quinone reductase